MRVRQLTSDGDFSFGNGSKNYFIDVPEAVGLLVEFGLLLWVGEWFLDTSLGMPWITGVLGKTSQATEDATIQNQVANTQGVTNIASYLSTRNNEVRFLNVQLTVNTIFGPTPVQIANYRTF